MREPVTAGRLRAFMRAIAAAAREPGRVYLTGGASAVLRGWRDSTVDVDIKVVPENDRILRAIPGLKETLNPFARPSRASPTARMPPACSPSP